MKIQLGDIENLYTGSYLSVDSTNGTLYVKLDKYEGITKITQIEAETLSAVFGRLKEVKE